MLGKNFKEGDVVEVGLRLRVERVIGWKDSIYYLLIPLLEYKPWSFMIQIPFWVYSTDSSIDHIPKEVMERAKKIVRGVIECRSQQFEESK